MYFDLNREGKGIFYNQFVSLLFLIQWLIFRILKIMQLCLFSVILWLLFIWSFILCMYVIREKKFVQIKLLISVELDQNLELLILEICFYIQK